MLRKLGTTLAGVGMNHQRYFGGFKQLRPEARSSVSPAFLLRQVKVWKLGLPYLRNFFSHQVTLWPAHLHCRMRFGISCGTGC